MTITTNACLCCKHDVTTGDDLCMACLEAGCSGAHHECISELDLTLDERQQIGAAYAAATKPGTRNMELASLCDEALYAPDMARRTAAVAAWRALHRNAN